MTVSHSAICAVAGQLRRFGNAARTAALTAALAFVGLAISGGAGAAPITYNFAGAGISCTDTNGVIKTTCDSETPSSVVLGTSTNYASYGITATGYKNYAFSKSGNNWQLQSNSLPGQGSGTLAQLFAKTATGDGVGLGLANGTSSPYENEIYSGDNDLIVLNLGSKFRFQNIALQPGSTSAPSTIEVAEYNLDANGNLSGSVLYTTPQTTDALISLSAGYQYIAVYATAGNVLLSSLQVTIPEPASAALFGSGLIAAWATRRRRRHV